jgi:hypothetical protein
MAIERGTGTVARFAGKERVMNDNRVKDALESIARRGVLEGTNLWPNISARLERESPMMTLRTRPVMAILVALLILLVLSGAVYALGHMLGYIPGVGFVEQNAPVRVLDEKLSVQREGITLTMKQLIADSVRTVVMYRIRGIPLYQGTAGQECTEAPALLLKNGARLESTDEHVREMGGENGVLSFDADFTFPPLPTEVQEVTLLTPCGLPPLPLRLVPAPQGFILPATEIPVTFDSAHPLLSTSTPFRHTETPAPETYPPGFPAMPTPVPHGSGLYLDKVVELEDSYLLVGNFTDAGDLPGIITMAQNVVPYEFHVADRDGNPVPFFFRLDLMSPSNWSNVTYWALEILKPVDSPITITLPEIPVSTEEAFPFRVNVGANPAIGQTWPLNQSVEIGGSSFLVENVTLSERGYTFTLRSPLSREQAFVDLRMEDHNVAGLSERFYDRNGYFELQETLVFNDSPPTGDLTFLLHLNVDRPAGPWTLTWSPP